MTKRQPAEVLELWIDTRETYELNVQSPKKWLVDAVMQSRIQHILSISRMRQSEDWETLYPNIKWMITSEWLIKNEDNNYVTAKWFPGIDNLSHIREVHIDGKTMQKRYIDTWGVTRPRIFLFADKNFVYALTPADKTGELFVVSSKPELFKQLDAGIESAPYFTDGENVFETYPKFNLVSNNPGKFKVLSHGYTQRDSSIHSLDKWEISNDWENFHVLWSGFAQDKEYMYYYGKRVWKSIEGIVWMKKLSEHYSADSLWNIYYIDRNYVQWHSVLQIRWVVDAKNFHYVPEANMHDYDANATTWLWTDGKDDYVTVFKVKYFSNQNGEIMLSTNTLFHGNNTRPVQLNDIPRLLKMWAVTQEQVNNDPLVIQRRSELTNQKNSAQKQMQKLKKISDQTEIELRLFGE